MTKQKDRTVNKQDRSVTKKKDIPVSAAQMHSSLDAYNNTGAINGAEFCCDADSELVINVLTQLDNLL